MAIRRAELSESERKELTRPAKAMTAHRSILCLDVLSGILRSLTRNTMSLVILAVIGAPMCGCGSQEAPVPSVPGSNIILIVVDTLRADHLGVYGYSRDTSPNIDAFARDALLFRRAYTPRPKTNSAMASLFTSSPPYAHGVRQIPQALPEGVLYIPEELQRNGYATAGVVSNVVLYEEYGFHRGFEVWKQLYDVGGRVTDQALEVLEALVTGKDDRPFFLWVHYMKPHTPYQPSPEYHSRFVGDALWAEEEVLFAERKWEAFGAIPQFANIDDNTNPHYYIAEYDAEIRDVDAEVGRLLDALRTRGLYDSSLIVLTADHGESLGEHNYYFEHGLFPYDVNGHVPLAIRHPGREPAVTDVPASLVDLLPTLLKAAELPVPEAAMGIDLFAAVDAKDTDRLIFAESGYEDEAQVSVRRSGWKLIHIPSEVDRKRLTGGLYELYNTDEDPLEERNLAGQGLAVESALAESLTAWVASWDEYSLPEVRTPEVSQETWDQLRALGYVHGGHQEREPVFSFLEHLERATIDSPRDSYVHVRKAAFAVAGEMRPVLFEHPDSDVTFDGFRINPHSTLKFGIGMNEKAWTHGGDGVQFEIIVNDGQGVERTVYSRYIDPKNRIEDRKWFDEVLDLSSFAGEAVSITFRTSSGPANSKLYDWSGWSEPKLWP